MFYYSQSDFYMEIFPLIREIQNVENGLSSANSLVYRDRDGSCIHYDLATG